MGEDAWMHGWILSCFLLTNWNALRPNFAICCFGQDGSSSLLEFDQAKSPGNKTIWESLESRFSYHNNEHIKEEDPLITCKICFTSLIWILATVHELLSLNRELWAPILDSNCAPLFRIHFCKRILLADFQEFQKSSAGSPKTCFCKTLTRANPLDPFKNLQTRICQFQIWIDLNVLSWLVTNLTHSALCRLNFPLNAGRYTGL